MNGSTMVQLKIPDGWMVWRGYLRGGALDPKWMTIYGATEEEKEYRLRTYQENMKKARDPMDTKTFDEALAFPLLKPDVDIFIPTHRTRKQRGWYQVTRRPSAMTSPYPRNSDASRPSFATGADIPPELIQLIYEEAHQDALKKHQRGLRQLGVFSLVCRHWSSIFRPVIFHDIGFRSGADISNVYEFSQKPPYQILQLLGGAYKYIKTSISAPPDSSPWMSTLR